MAPLLPDRYQIHVRLGRDGDIEEWLATDTALDRPVLVRILGPESSPERQSRFLDAMTAAARTAHVHVAPVFAAAATPDDGGAYAIVEWGGGITIADRMAASDTLPVDEFLPNAAGLASGLAAFHAEGGIHGAIDPSAIQFSTAHPAKLSSFGRPATGGAASEDVRQLAETLRTAVTGTSDPDIAPSSVAHGIPSSVDSALDAAINGDVDAGGLAAALRSAPTSPPSTSSPAWSWTWASVFAGLLVAALVIAVAGLAIDVDPNSPLLFPATPTPSTSTTTPLGAIGGAPAGTDTTGVINPGRELPATPAVYDPFAGGTENDSVLPNIADGDDKTSWRTERYFDPIGLLKPGVGVIFDVTGTPSQVEILASPGTTIEILWASAVPESFDEWRPVASAMTGATRTTLDVSDRQDEGIWLLWLTDLPSQESGESFYSHVYEVRFVQ